MVLPLETEGGKLMYDREPVIFNYDLDEYHCEDCKYSKWYSEGKKYGCPESGMRRICGSFRKYESEEK